MGARTVGNSSHAIFALAVFLVCAVCLLPSRAAAQAAPASATAATPSSPVEPEDPYKASSELNHHIAGYALVAVGLLVIVGQSSPRLRFLRLLWPALFILTGLFLAAWSDHEIWPRGDLSWTWLIQHDLGARQHKIFAILLILMGTIEWLRARGKLNRFWKTWAFPLLAVFGAALLLFHPHSKATGATSPGPPQHSEHAGMDMPAHHGDDGMSAQHTMTSSMVLVEREHLWFAVVGAAIALFKFLSDGGFWRRWFLPYLWPSTMALLGVLLVFYRE